MRRLRDVVITTVGFGVCLANLLALLTLLASYQHNARWLADFGGRPMIWVAFREGSLSVHYGTFVRQPPGPKTRMSELAGIRVENKKWGAAGSKLGWRRTSLTLPWWASLVVLCLPFWPLHFVLSGPVRNSFRRLRGQCVHCGYNLRGSPSNICSECGKAFDPDEYPAAVVPGAPEIQQNAREEAGE